MIKQIDVKSRQRSEFIDITGEVQKIIAASGVDEGICCIYVPHTTAAVTINEGADPAVQKDILTMMDRLVPSNGDYSHTEGNSDAHIKALLTGSPVNVIINAGRLLLGTWQSIYFCEFDGPRDRKVDIKIIVG